MGFQLGGRAHRPLGERAAAIRTAALQGAGDALGAECAFERADEGVRRIGRQVLVAAFAVRAKVKHRRILRERSPDRDNRRNRPLPKLAEMTYFRKIMPKSLALDPPPNGPLVVALVYDGLCTFEFGVAYEVFGLRRPEMGPGWYRFRTAAVEEGPLRAAGGLGVTPDGGAELLEQANLIVIPGWRGIDQPAPPQLQRALHGAAARGARIATLCSGVFVLAATGLLAGRRATTHWRYADALKSRYPDIDVRPDVLYIDNGPLLTAAGSAAGIDLCLHIVRQDFGVEAANGVARRLVVPPHRDGGQAQFIPRPVPRPRESQRLGALLDWMDQNLGGDLGVAALAKRAGMSARTFQRRFEETTGRAPGDYVIQARVARAQALMEAQPDIPLDEVADLSGFGSIETMRHHFSRRTKTSPQAWRRRFGGGVSTAANETLGAER
jgi:AraC family transcriptional regulator, transcriptional activator FtrA